MPSSASSSEEECEATPEIPRSTYLGKIRKALRNMDDEDSQQSVKSFRKYKKYDKLLSDYQVSVAESRTKKKDGKTAKQEKMFGVSPNAYICNPARCVT